jgi:YtkA-like protein
MKRIATPMIGGVITSAILNLLIYPVIYVIWRKRSLPPELAGGSSAGRSISEPTTVASGSRRRILAGSTAVLLIGIFIAALWHRNFDLSIGRSEVPVTKVTQDGVTVSILSVDGEIHAKDNVLQIKFQDPGGHPVDAENVKLELNMDMPGMVMHSGAKIKKDDGTGDYQAQLTPDMAGDWSVDLSYQGPQGPAKLKVPVNVTQ